MGRRRRYEELRATCSRLAVDACGPGAEVSRIMAMSIYFESFILRGGDATQKRMRIMPEQAALVLTGPGSDKGDGR